LLAFLNRPSGRDNAKPIVPAQSLDPLVFLDSSTNNQPSTVNNNKQNQVVANEFPLELNSGTNKELSKKSFSSSNISNSTIPPPKQTQKTKSQPVSGDPFQQMDNPFDIGFDTDASKDKGNNPFDTLDDPFSSMGSIKPTDASKNPFSVMTNNPKTTNSNTEEFDTGDDPFANFPQ